MDTTLGTLTRTAQHRPLGALAAAGGLAYFIADLFLIDAGDAIPPAANALSLAWALGCLCGLVGIGLLGAAGRGIFGRVALALATLAYAVAALDALLILAGAYAGEASPFFIASRLGTVAGMLLVGIATVAARRWPGWRRFAPLALPLALPVSFAFSAATGIINIVLFVGLAWILIGYAVWSTPSPS